MCACNQIGERARTRRRRPTCILTLRLAIPAISSLIPCSQKKRQHPLGIVVSCANVATAATGGKSEKAQRARTENMWQTLPQTARPRSRMCSSDWLTYGREQGGLAARGGRCLHGDRGFAGASRAVVQMGERSTFGARAGRAAVAEDGRWEIKPVDDYRECGCGCGKGDVSPLLSGR